MKHLNRAGLLVASAAAVAGCAEGAGCEGEWCGTAVITTTEPDVLLPPVAEQDAATSINDLLFLKLADVGPSLNALGDGDFQPRLAQTWTFDDPRTIRFTLHPGARWHDGRPVTAADVAFTFDVYRDTLVNAGARPLLERIVSVTAAEPRTVVFRFSRPYVEQFFDAVYHMRILPRHLLDTIPRKELASHRLARQSVGSGPFRFVQWVAGQFVELEADSVFFLGRPGLRRLIWRIIPDVGTAVTQLVAGEADVQYFLGAPENVARVRDASHLRAVSYPSNQYAYIVFNLREPDRRDRPHPLFAERGLRQALSMAVDRGAAARAVLGEMGEPGVGPVSRVLSIWSDSIHALPFDSARARRTLEELGWVDRNGDGVRERGGRRLEFELLVPSTSQLRRRLAVVAQDQLHRVGAAVRINELDFNTFVSRTRSQQFEAAFVSWGQDPSLRSIRQNWSTAAIGASNYGSYSSAAFDRLTEAAGNATDTARAHQIWLEAIRVINEDAPAIWMYNPVTMAAVHRRLQNVTFRPDQWAALMWTWHVHPDSVIARDKVAVR